MPFQITKTKPELLPVDAVLLFRCEQMPERLRKRLNDRRNTVPDANCIFILPHKNGQRRLVRYVGDAAQADKDAIVSIYHDVLEEAVRRGWSSVAVPLFPRANPNLFPANWRWQIAVEEIRKTLARSELNIYLVVENENDVHLDSVLYSRLRSVLAGFPSFESPSVGSMVEAEREKPANISSERKVLKPRFEGVLAEYATVDDLGYSHKERDRSFYSREQKDKIAENVNITTQEAAPVREDHIEPEPGGSPAPLPALDSYELSFDYDEDPFDSVFKLFPSANSSPVSPEIAVSEKAVGSEVLRFNPNSATIMLDESFPEAVLRLIDQKGMSDPECYSRANLSRAVFNKLKQSALNPEKVAYRPSKSTALALAVALELGLDEANDLLKKAGYTLSHSNKGDIIVEYFLANQLYDIFELNEVLFKFGEPLLGSM